jgi:hypothetical protein
VAAAVGEREVAEEEGFEEEVAEAIRVVKRSRMSPRRGPTPSLLYISFSIAGLVHDPKNSRREITSSYKRQRIPNLKTQIAITDKTIPQNTQEISQEIKKGNYLNTPETTPQPPPPRHLSSSSRPIIHLASRFHARYRS